MMTVSLVLWDDQDLHTTEIVARLGISDCTARTHVQRILSKLCVHSRLEAVAMLAERGSLGDERLSGREGREGQWSSSLF